MSIVNAVNADPINDEDGRISVINEGKGAKIIASNQCGDFKFDLYKAPDARTDHKTLTDYDNKIYAYVGQGIGQSTSSKGLHQLFTTEVLQCQASLGKFPG